MSDRSKRIHDIGRIGIRTIAGRIRVLRSHAGPTSSVVQALSAAVLFTVPIVANSQNRTSMEPLHMTQCFRDRTVRPCEQWKSGGEYCKWFFESFPLDQKRGCYGQRWSIPRAYYDRKYTAYKPITEAIVIRVVRPGLTAGNLQPKEKVVRLYHEVKIYPLWTGKYDDHVRHIQASRQSLGWRWTSQVMYGMSVYDKTPVPQDQYRDVFLFPESNKEVFVSCIVRPGESIDKKDPDGPCNVVGNVDDRVRVEYHIRYSELPAVSQINAKLVGLVRGFMVGGTKK